MKTLAFAFALLALFMVTGQTQVIKQNGGTPGTIAKSTFTITGTGAKCFSVNDPTLVVDCGNNRVGIGTSSPADKISILTPNSTVNALGLYSADNSNRLAWLFNTTANESTMSGHDSDGSTIRIKFNAGSAVNSYINTGANFGIGTTSPATVLDVNGNAQFGSGATKSTFTATGFWQPLSQTRAQINTLVPTAVGQVIYASDTTLPGLCISTGTLASQWRKMESATLGCGTNN